MGPVRTDRKLAWTGVMLGAGGTLMLVIFVVFNRLVMSACHGMGCIPAMIAFYGAVVCAPFPLVLILSILTLKRQRWAYKSLVVVSLLILAAAALLFVYKIRADLRLASVREKARDLAVRVERANRATYNLVADATTIDGVTKAVGRPPDQMMHQTGGRTVYFYDDEVLCAQVIEHYRHSRLTVIVNDATGVVEVFSCQGR